MKIITIDEVFTMYNEYLSFRIGSSMWDMQRRLRQEKPFFEFCESLKKEYIIY